MSRGTLDTASGTLTSCTGLSPSLAGFPKTILLSSANTLCSPNPAMHARRFGLFPFRSPLLWKSIIFFLFLRLLRCFSSPGSLDKTMDSSYRDGALPPPGFPIRTSMDQYLLAVPHGFSQLTTSFFGSWCQGIHLMLFFACPINLNFFK